MHRQPVAVDFAGPLAHLHHALGDAEQRLQVMPDFVGDDVGLGEVARGAELLVELAEELEVDVDLLIEPGNRTARPPLSWCRTPTATASLKSTSVGG